MSVSPKASRPHIAGYGIPKTKKGMVSWDWAEEQLKMAKNYWVATTRPDGHPHSIPSWGNWLDGKFYFGGGEKTRHIRNLAANPAVVLHLESGDNVVIVEAVAEKAQDIDADLRARLEADSRSKYGMGAGGTEGIWVATPTVAFVWKDGLHSATRFVFDK